MLSQCCRCLEELLAGHREELGRTFKRIRVDRQSGSVALLLLQAIPGAREDLRPHAAIHAPMQWRKAVGIPVEHVELVRHFVDDHVVPGFLPGIQHIRPGQDHRPAAPCLSGHHAAGLVNHSRRIHVWAPWNERVRIHDDAVPTVVPVHAQFQDGQASMRRDQDPVGVLEMQALGRLQRLALQEQRCQHA